MKKYFNHQVKKAIIVQNLITVESLNITEAFSYPEETHDFHEFAYIESGAIWCHLENKKTLLSQGDFLLIQPNVGHFYSAAEKNQASIFIICFRCKADILSIFSEKITLPTELKHLMADIVQESKNAFSFPFNRKLKLQETPLYGSQQLVESNVEKLLICLVRNETKQNEHIKLVMNSVEKEQSLINDILVLLEAHLYSRITLDEISRQTYYSKTFLNRIFNKNMGTTIMQYYNEWKLKEAKRLLRKNHAPSEVAAQLGFESATYFTKAFKKYTGMTPSAYKKRALS